MFYFLFFKRLSRLSFSDFFTLVLGIFSFGFQALCWGQTKEIVPGLIVHLPIPSSTSEPKSLSFQPPPPQMPGWPKQINVYDPYWQLWPLSTCRLSDLDNDGDLEIIVGSSDGIAYVWQHDGTYYSGWENGRFYGNQYPFQCTPAIGDIEDSGSKDIVIAGIGNIYRLDKNGNVYPGWPKQHIGYNDIVSAVLYDLDGDSKLEIIFGEYGVKVYKANGSNFPGWPANTNGSCLNLAPSVGDLEGNGSSAEIVAATWGDNYTTCYIYAWRSDGTSVTGWPKVLPDESPAFSAPTLVDLDNNGDLEIFYVTSPAKLHAFHHDGTPVAGFPISYEGQYTWAVPVVGDVDGDGDIEIFTGDAYQYYDNGIDNLPTFYGWHHTGAVMQNWPRIIGGNYTASWSFASPLLVDIDGDAEIEVVTASFEFDNPTNSQRGAVYAFNPDGSVVNGFPFTTSSAHYMGGPDVGDVDRDGDLEMALVSTDGVVNLWDFPTPYNLSKIEWGQMHRNERNTGLYEQPVSGSLQQNTTWWGWIKVRNTVTVPAGKTLNLQGGATVHFAPGAVLNVSGQIKVTGSPYEPVIFDGNSNVNFLSGANVTLNPGTAVTVEGTLTIASGATITGGGSIVKSGSGQIFVTNSASALASNNSRKIARGVNGNYHLVFETAGEICYERLTNTGALTEFRRLSNGVADGVKSNPSIYVRDNNILAVWQKYTNGSHDITFHKSTDYGVTWPTSNRKVIASGVGSNPPLPVIASQTTNHVLVVYRTATNLSSRTSPDYGANWNPVATVPSSGAQGNSPSLAVTTSSGSPATVMANATSGGVGTIFYRYYPNTSWDLSLTNLSAVVPGTYTGHKSPSLAPSGTAGHTTLHVAWEAKNASNNGVIIHRKATSLNNWVPNTYYALSLGDEKQPSITGLQNDSAELLFEHRDTPQGETQIYKIHYTGSIWDLDLFSYISLGFNPSISVGYEAAKYVWTSYNATPPYQIQTDPEISVLSKSNAAPFSAAYHRSIAVIDTAAGKWLEVRLDKLAVKTKSGEELAIPFVEAKEDDNTLTPANAFANLASSSITLPAEAESLFVHYRVNGQGLSAIKKRDNAINVEMVSSKKNGAMIKLPVINTFAESLPETKRTMALAASNLAGKEFSLRTQVSGIDNKSSLIASLGHIYEIVETPIGKTLEAIAENTAPQDYSLSAYPNPFPASWTFGNPSTQIHFAMKEAGRAAVRIYNLNGQLIRELLNEYRTAGEHSTPWDGRDARGAGAASGVYFIRFEAGQEVKLSKVMLVR